MNGFLDFFGDCDKYCAVTKNVAKKWYNDNANQNSPQRKSYKNPAIP